MLRLMMIVCGILLVVSCGMSDELKWVPRYMEVEATAYCLCEKCTKKKVHDGKTADMKDAYQPGVAVDPKIIPYGSRVDCEEYSRKKHWILVDDCSEAKENGGRIFDNHVDFRFNNHQEALDFGRKLIIIRVWELK